MTAQEIVDRIVAAVECQSEALADSDYPRLEALIAETATLCQALDGASAALTLAERTALVATLGPAIEQANQFIDTIGSRVGETRREIQEVRQGRTATSAYRQASPREAAMRFSRQG